MGDLLIQKTVQAEECERFANALTGRECRCDPSKLYTISVKTHGVAEQHQGEPVAWLIKWASDGSFYMFTQDRERSEKLRNDPEFVATPLYTHADPGEAERLTRKAANADLALAAQTRQVHSLRAQLAERDALLRSLKNRAVHEWASGKIEDEIDAALSASAEPSAPVERDERAEFEVDFKARYPDAMHDIELGRNAEGDYLMTPACFEWEGWQARAALSASAEPSGPVEITDEQIIEAMRENLNDADGGYVVDTAPQEVVKAGRALLARAALERNK